MAIVDQDTFIDNLPGREGEMNPTQPTPEVQKEKSHPLMRTLDSALRKENALTSIIFNGIQDTTVKDPDFDPFKNIENTEWADQADKFIYADSDEEVEEVKRRITEERRHSQILEESGWTGTVASMFAGIFDPTLLIPGTTAIKAGKLAARIHQGARSGATLGAVALGGQQLALAATQLEKTQQDAASAAVTGALLGGFLGAGAGALARTTKSAGDTLVTRVMKDEPDVSTRLAEDGTPQPRSVGAAEAVASKEDEGIANLNDLVAKNVSSVIPGLRSPTIQGLTSKFVTSREVTNGLFEHNFILGKNIHGKTSEVAVETQMKLDGAQFNKMHTEVRDIYLGMVGVTKGPLKEARALVNAKRGKFMSFQQFSEETAKAMRRNDEHAIPEIAKAAQRIRKEMDEFTVKMQEHKLLPEDLDVKTARSYFMRKYNNAKIIQNRNQFKGIVEDYLRKQKQKAGEDIEDDFISLDADKIISNILGQGDQALAMDDVVTHINTTGGKFTKERVFLIDDELIEDFLVSDAVEMSTSYLGQASSTVRLHDYLSTKGLDSVQDLRKDLLDEFEGQLAKLPEGSEEAVRLTKEFDKDLKLMNDQVSIITGQFGKKGKGDAAFRALRKYQVMRLLGGMTISALPDLAMPVFRNGLSNTIKDGYITMARSIKDSKLSRDELKDFFVGVELETNDLLRQITDPNHTVGQGRSSFEKVSDAATSGFAKLTGMTHWNNFHKRLAGQVSSARTLRAIDKWSRTGKMNEKEALRLSSLGIGPDSYKKIADNFKTHGQKSSGSYVGNYKHWDGETSRLFGAATLKDVDSTIITPGRGDIPRIVQETEIGKTIFQFKSFVASATNKVLLSGLQRRDKDVLTGFIGLLGLGAAAYTLKQKINGKKVDLSIESLLLEGFSRSGTGGLMGDAIIGLNPWMNSSRYAGLNAQGFLLGPSSNLISDVFTAGTEATKNLQENGELDSKDAKRISRLLPFQNLFYIRILMEHSGLNF